MMTDDNRGGEEVIDQKIKGSSGTAKLWRVCGPGLPEEKCRLHTHIEGRYITLFREKGKLSAMDSVCYHAGGPLTLGPLQDIEDLDGITAVSCPWHKFLVSITDGTRVYQQVTIVNGKPSVKGWTIGKVVQRCHNIFEDESGVYVSSQISDATLPSDKDACDTRCMKDFIMHEESILCASP